MDDKQVRSASGRVLAARERWRGHLAAQRSSGKSQVEYCREHDLDPRYFSVWKGKLSSPTGSKSFRHQGASATLVPVRIRRAAPVTAARRDAVSTLSARLPNGVVVDVRASSARQLGELLGELSRLSC